MPWRDIHKFRKWYNENKVRIRAYQEEWVKRNRDKVRASTKRSYYKNKAKRKKDYDKLRYQALVALGRCCFVCQVRQSLHFHHLEYFPDSVRHMKPHRINDGEERLKEAIAHPERFVLLCIEHHMKLEALKIKLKRGLSQFPVELQRKIIEALYNNRLF